MQQETVAAAGADLDSRLLTAYMQASVAEAQEGKVHLLYICSYKYMYIHDPYSELLFRTYTIGNYILHDKKSFVL